MIWTVDFHPDFATDVDGYSKPVRRALLKGLRYLEEFGPSLGRPHADTLSQSKFTNMKELRFKADNGVWRIAYAFDPERRAILLVGGDKSVVSQQQFYKTLIQKADERYTEHLNTLSREKKP